MKALTIADLLAQLQQFDPMLTVEVFERTKDIPFEIHDFEIKCIRHEHEVVAIQLSRKD